MIIWLDDDITAIRSFREEVETLDEEVIQVTNPDEFYQSLKIHYRDTKAFIIDIMLPTGKSINKDKSARGIRAGLEVIKFLRGNANYKDIPILVFTIIDEQELLDWAGEAGIDILYKLDTDPEEVKDWVSKSIKNI